jgi:hypothetical protein
VAGLGRKVWAADEILAAEDLQDYIQDQVVFVYDTEAARTSGILSPTEGMISYLKNTNLLYAFDGSSWVEIAPNVGTPGTYTKVTTDTKGRVTSGTTLAAGDIPNLDTAKLTSGLLPLSRGGTNASDAAGARSQLGITATNVPTTGSNVQADIDFINTKADSGVTALTRANQARDGDFDISVWNRDVSGFASRRAAWLGNDGRILLGHTASSERFKTNFQDSGIDPLKVLEIDVVLYQNKELVAKAKKDPSVRVPTDVGMVAERLHEAGLWQFVMYERDENDELVLNKKGDAIPYGIHYELWALAVHEAARFVWSRVQDLEARVARLESK